MHPFRVSIRRAFLLVAMLIAGCSEQPLPPAHAPSSGSPISLTVVDGGTTEGILRIALAETSAVRSVRLCRDGAAALNFSLAGKETLLVDEPLLPGRTWRYEAFLVRDTAKLASSGLSLLRTLDSTSHDFRWEIDTLGEWGGSLSDVAIVNDTLAYAVGELYMRDSAGGYDGTPYNLAKWNGNKWELMRVPFPVVCGAEVKVPVEATAVWAFGPDNIWVACYVNELANIRTNNGTLIYCPPVRFGITKIWGENPQSIYVAGITGELAHYTGTWRMIETGTTQPIQDIWGAKDPLTGKTEIIFVASKWDQNEGKVISWVDDAGTRPVSAEGLTWPTLAVWFAPHMKYFVTGDGIYWKTSAGDKTPWKNDSLRITRWRTECVRGSGVNDVVAAGDGGSLSHFNGSTWKSFYDETKIDGLYRSVAIRGNLIMAAGYLSNRGIVAVGRR